MSYDQPTSAQFRARFPAFAAVPFEAIDSALTEASGRVDTSWQESDFQIGIMLYAAHVLTLDGQGTSREAFLGGVQQVTIGPMSVSRGTGAAATDIGSLKATSYGQRFLQLSRGNAPGVLVV